MHSTTEVNTLEGYLSSRLVDGIDNGKESCLEDIISQTRELRFGIEDTL